ncbi:MAG TPA: hypothetical protein VFB58_11935 [Chloroflexota bacterium]|nr:hypothetical protein [Chloroflexota bacterium]
MRVRGLFAALTLSVGLLGVTGALSASQALASGGNTNSGVPAKDQVVTVISGSQPEGTAEIVNGLPAAQAGGSFQQGTATTDQTGAASTSSSTMSPGMIAASAPSGCGDAQVNWEADLDLFGATVWKIWNHTHWCWGGWDVTSVTGWKDTWTAPGWTTSNAGWGWQWWSAPHTAFTNAHAKFCFINFYGCVQESDPVVHTWINGAGNWSFDDQHWYPHL